LFRISRDLLPDQDSSAKKKGVLPVYDSAVRLTCFAIRLAGCEVEGEDVIHYLGEFVFEFLRECFIEIIE